tara:strand:- start:2495 stop:2899 length:405 start_codon:yes stop_codon:yes gene_type:complete
MKIILISVFFTSIIFLIIDVIWLSYTVKYFYKPQLGDLLNEKPVMWAAIGFYLVYVIGLSIVILQPAIINDSISQAFWMGLVFGIVAYGTYNLTNMATVKNWSSYVVFVDMFWGGILTGTSSATGIFIAKKIIN